MTEIVWAPLIGDKRAKCSVCGCVFSTDSNFDQHRQGDHALQTRHCLPPESVGLVLKQVAGGVLYSMPGMTEEQLEDIYS